MQCEDQHIHDNELEIALRKDNGGSALRNLQLNNLLFGYQNYTDDNMLARMIKRRRAERAKAEKEDQRRLPSKPRPVISAPVQQNLEVGILNTLSTGPSVAVSSRNDGERMTLTTQPPVAVSEPAFSRNDGERRTAIVNSRRANAEPPPARRTAVPHYPDQTVSYSYTAQPFKPQERVDSFARSSNPTESAFTAVPQSQPSRPRLVMDLPRRPRNDPPQPFYYEPSYTHAQPQIPRPMPLLEPPVQDRKAGDVVVDRCKLAGVLPPIVFHNTASGRMFSARSSSIEEPTSNSATPGAGGEVINRRFLWSHDRIVRPSMAPLETDV
ncbi:hypothetical protein BV898_11729 [Hypsibius exemplaris]|uniref:Uncharacterized protein n=1 Tax=Hypsibius exemplaris TaxID=2072580 RepID=A0A1W0WFT7_HYPEX|nr:hypothetical protein BV898_11729 [Hypsibius exemplaris]